MPDIAGDIVKVTIATTFPTEFQVQMINLSYVCTVAGGSDTRAALGNALLNQLSGDYVLNMNVNSTLFGYKVSYLNRTPPPAAVTGGTSQPGVLSGTFAPTQCRPLLRWTTQFAGRKYRGRVYMFTPNSTMVGTGGIPAAAVVTSTNNFAALAVAAFTSAGSTWHLCIAHRPPPGGVWSSTQVTGYTDVDIFATQRRSSRFGRVNTIPPW